MKTTIIIPAYNAERHLAETIDSVIAQTVVDWELIVVDDGSRDGTFELVQAYSKKDDRIKAVRKVNGGVADTRCFGYALADPASEFVAFLDHDDLWKPSALETLIGALSANPHAVAAHGLARKVTFDGRSCEADHDGILSWERRKIVGNRVVVCKRSEPTTFAVLAYDGCMCTPGLVLIRRSAIQDMPLFQQELAPSDDGEFWIRLSLRGDFAFADEVVLDWRQHEGNVSKNENLLATAMSRARLHVMHLPELTHEQRRIACFRYRRMYASVIRHNSGDCRRWAMESLRKGHVAEAVSYYKRSFGLSAQYLTLRLFWTGLEDKGPIPARLKDQARLEQNTACVTH